MIPEIFFVAAVVGALHTFLALVRVRRPGLFSFPYFMAGWLAGELGRFHVLWQGVATAVFVGLGALGETIGWIGLGLTLVSWIGLYLAHRIALRTGPVVEAALVEGLGADYRREIAPEHQARLQADPSPEAAWHPFRYRRPGVEVTRDLDYGPAGKRNRLDVYRPSSHPERAPVLLQVHGGAWVSGRKDQQGQPLMWELTGHGWVCLAINYRLSPRATFPDHLVDVKRAIAWVHANADEYGMDPNFIVATGGSAGGHLSALAALTPNQPEYQPGFEDVDTTLAGCVPLYGVYDFMKREGVRNDMERFLRRMIMGTKRKHDGEGWHRASPRSQVRAGAPPFFVLHGTHDSLAWVEQARAFVADLRAVSNSSVTYAELPGAQHAFDLFHSARSGPALAAVTRWLAYQRTAYEAGSAPRPSVVQPIEDDARARA